MIRETGSLTLSFLSAPSLLARLQVRPRLAARLGRSARRAHDRRRHRMRRRDVRVPRHLASVPFLDVLAGKDRLDHFLPFRPPRGYHQPFIPARIRLFFPRYTLSLSNRSRYLSLPYFCPSISCIEFHSLCFFPLCAQGVYPHLCKLPPCILNSFTRTV